MHWNAMWENKVKRSAFYGSTQHSLFKSMLERCLSLFKVHKHCRRHRFCLVGFWQDWNSNTTLIWTDPSHVEHSSWGRVHECFLWLSSCYCCILEEQGGVQFSFSNSHLCLKWARLFIFWWEWLIRFATVLFFLHPGNTEG